MIGEPRTAELRSAYTRLVEDRFGMRLSEQQAQRLDALVEALANRSGHADPLDLAAALRAGRFPELLEELAASVAIGETHFFRVSPQIEALRNTILPEVIARQHRERRIRVWSAGCSTGEEPYTLAILVRELLPSTHGWDVSILATDVSQPALATARAARYQAWSFRDTPEWIRRRYFLADGKGWRLVDEIRDMVRFEPLNLVADVSPLWNAPGSFDVVLCRNVTIYFAAETTRRLYRRLGEALRPGGWLVLGPSDPVPDHPDLLQPVYLSGAVLWRRAASPSAADQVTFPSASTARSPAPRPPARPSASNAPAGGRTRTAAPVGRANGAPVASPARPREATSPDPTDAAAHLRRGMQQLDQGPLPDALESLRRATFLDQADPLAQFGLGRAYALTGNTRRALAAFLHARRLLTGVPDADEVAGGDGLTVARLRHALEAQIATLGPEAAR